ncbi:hypothetical protein CDIK_1846 [Cucumispora dikerogammari]|nr:hypothetical protein CDIK_1846 [Cucumispora dikerogammari]
MLTLITNFRTTFCVEAEVPPTTNQDDEKQKDLDYIASKIQKNHVTYWCNTYPLNINLWFEWVILTNDLNLDIKLQTIGLVKCKEVFRNGEIVEAHKQDIVVRFSTVPFRCGTILTQRVEYKYITKQNEFKMIGTITNNTPKYQSKEHMWPPAQQVFIDNLKIDEEIEVISLYKFIIKVQFTLKEESKKSPNVVVEY